MLCQLENRGCSACDFIAGDPECGKCGWYIDNEKMGAVNTEVPLPKGRIRKLSQVIKNENITH